MLFNGRDPYDSAQVSPEEIMRRYDAATAASLHNVGLYVNHSNVQDVIDVEYLLGVIRACMRGKKPDYKPGMRVRARSRVQSYNVPGSLVLDTDSGIFTVKQVWYSFDFCWYLELVEVGGPNSGPRAPTYRASEFEVVREPAKA